MIFDPNMTSPSGACSIQRSGFSVPRRGSEPKAADPVPQDRPRVLLVEDEDDLRVLLSKVISKRLSASVVSAVDGLDGVRQLRDHDFELIISDVRMPRLSGVALWNWTRANRPDLARRFLFITGDPGSDENRQALRESRRTVLNKPFSLAEFEMHCKRILGLVPLEQSA